MPLNTDPAALPDEDYWAAYEEWVQRHPGEFHEIPDYEVEHYPAAVGGE